MELIVVIIKNTPPGGGVGGMFNGPLCQVGLRWVSPDGWALSFELSICGQMLLRVVEWGGCQGSVQLVVDPSLPPGAAAAGALVWAAVALVWGLLAVSGGVLVARPRVGQAPP